MGVIIDCNQRAILNLKNSLFRLFYSHIIKIIEDTNIILPISVESLIDKLQMGGYGLGTDIAKYLYNYNDTLIFSRIVREAIETTEKNYPGLVDPAKISLWNFHKEIEEYAQELKNKEIQTK